ncbi:MAG TPA: hypothetical protein VGK73_03935 [Polyangiaceae bacterium]
MRRLTPTQREWMSPEQRARADAAIAIIDQLFPDGMPYSWQDAAVCNDCWQFYWHDVQPERAVLGWELCALCEQPTVSGIYRRLLVANVPSKGVMH